MDSELDAVLVADTDDGPPSFSLSEYYAPALKEAGFGPAPRLPAAPQLGVVALGTWLRRADLSVSVHDNVFGSAASRAAFLAALDRRPRAVGISTTLIMAAASVAKIAGWVRQHSPGSVVVLGGLMAERQPEARSCADVTVAGAGEETLTELILRLRQGRDWRDLGNLIYVRDGREVATPRTEPSLESLPVPDWGLLRPRFWRCYPIEASKGCRYRCAFCGDRDLGHQRMRSPEAVVHELREVHERFGARLFRFMDSNLTSWPEQTETLCRLLQRERLPIEWSCYARIDNLLSRPTLAAAMRRAGCRWLFYGIESGCDAILRAMNKGYNRADALSAVRLAREAGLYVHGNFIVGFPGETTASVDETIGLVREAGLAVVNFQCLGLPADSVTARLRSRFNLRVTKEGGWAHDTMDSAQARAEARRCLQDVIDNVEGTLPGTEFHVMLFLRGGGLSEEEAMDYLRATRDYNRAVRSSDA